MHIIIRDKFLFMLIEQIRMKSGRFRLNVKLMPARQKTRQHSHTKLTVQLAEITKTHTISVCRMC